MVLNAQVGAGIGRGQDMANDNILMTKLKESACDQAFYYYPATIPRTEVQQHHILNGLSMADGIWSMDNMH